MNGRYFWLTVEIIARDAME